MAVNLTSLILKLERLKSLTSNQNTTYLSNRLLNNIERIVKDRIFDRGLDSSFNKIGAYSTEAFKLSKIPADPNAFQFYSKKTKSASSDWDSIYNSLKGKAEGGTVQLRQAQNLQTFFVDLTYTGKLKNSIRVRALGNIIEIYISGSVNVEKMAWAESHFNKDIFSLNAIELNDIQSLTSRNLRLFIRDILQ